MKRSAAVRNGVANQGLSMAKVVPYKGPHVAQKLQERHRLRAAAGVVERPRVFQPAAPPATSDSSPTNNIVSLGHGQAARALQSMDRPSQDKAVPENVASAQAWIAAWKAKQHNAPTSPAVPENVTSARAWIAAWKAKNQELGASGDELHALRHEVEKLKSLVSASGAAAEAAQVELSRTAAQRDALASSLAREVFEGTSLRKQRDTARAALNNGQDHAPATHSQKQRAEVQAAAAGQPGSAAAAAAAAAPERLPKPAAAAAAAAAPAGGFTNTNRYWVPRHLEPKFLRAVAERQAAMERGNGFLGLSIRELSDATHPIEEFVLAVSSSWATVPDWEAWSGGRESLRHQLPNGIMQFPPRKGEGFPEDYVPFKDLAGEVPNAKY